MEIINSIAPDVAVFIIGCVACGIFATVTSKWL